MAIQSINQSIHLYYCAVQSHSKPPIGQIFGVDREVSLLNELVRGESLNSKLRTLASRDYRYRSVV